MSVNTLERETFAGPTASDDDYKDPPPPAVYVPSGEGDDRYYINNGLDELSAHANADQPRSVADGWEERARDVRPGRGYQFEELTDRHPAEKRKLGGTALYGSLESRHHSYGMPHKRRNTVGAFIAAGNFRI